MRVWRTPNPVTGYVLGRVPRGTSQGVETHGPRHSEIGIGTSKYVLMLSGVRAPPKRIQKSKFPMSDEHPKVQSTFTDAPFGYSLGPSIGVNKKPHQ